ncbi:MAG: hypothetical protein IAE80_23325 [Anaerolinea sp.]|nr:hypothetical protein [Anaerolinea sp.]
MTAQDTRLTETILENQYATLYFHTDTKIVHHVFHQQIGGEEFRRVLNAGVELMKARAATKWLSDDRNNGVLSPEDTDWSMQEWFPRSKAAGWQFWALVVPADMMARLNLKEFVDSYYEQGLRIMVFTETEDAMQWLAAL